MRHSVRSTGAGLSVRGVRAGNRFGNTAAGVGFRKQGFMRDDANLRIGTAWWVPGNASPTPFPRTVSVAVFAAVRVVRSDAAACAKNTP